MYAVTDIVYSYELSHFGCKIGERVYDITGDVTNNTTWESWVDGLDRDSSQWKRITEQCIMLVPNDFMRNR